MLLRPRVQLLAKPERFLGKAALVILPSTGGVRSGTLAAMSKTLIYTLAMIGDLIFAFLAWRTGRVVIPIILVFAAFCFAAAAIGSALGKGRPK